MSAGATIAKVLVLALLTVPFMRTAGAAVPPKEETDPPLPPDPPEVPPERAVVPLPAEGYPTITQVPTESPQPRATPKAAKFRALKRYEVTLDALPVTGVTLQFLVDSVLPYLRLVNPDFSSTEVVRRNTFAATRVRFTASCLFNHDEALDRERSIAGVGSVWLVRIVDRGAY